MRQNDLSFANFILRFGPDHVLLDKVEEVVIPAFLSKEFVREHGETRFSFFNVKLDAVGEEKDGTPILALSGHLVKDTVLRRQQIFRPDRGLIDDTAEIESAPSSFFILLLNNHRLLYFAETAAAPTLDTFRATAEHVLREQWRRYVRSEQRRINVTRRVTIKELERRIPPPVLAVVRVAGEEAIVEAIQRFKRIKQVRFRLVEPNDELDASAAVAAVEQALRPLEPSRLEVVAVNNKGLNKDETARAVEEAAEGQNTEIVVDGEDETGSRLQADNEEFALSVPIGNPPDNDYDLQQRLLEKYDELVQSGKVRRAPTPSRIRDTLRRLRDLL